MTSDIPSEVASWQRGARRKVFVTLAVVVAALAGAVWFAYACLRMPGQ